MTKQHARELAQRIAARLFVNGEGQRAERLVLTVDRPSMRDLGGWCERAVVDQIADALLSAEPPAPKEGQ